MSRSSGERALSNALDRLGLELRYQLEPCPCSGVADDYVELRLDG